MVDQVAKELFRESLKERHKEKKKKTSIDNK